MVEWQADESDAAGSPCWRLAAGVGLLAGTVIGGTERPGEAVYVLVKPNGHRYLVTEPLYRLAEFLAAPLRLAEVTARLGERLGRRLEDDQVARLIESKLAAEGLAVLVSEPLPQTRGSTQEE